MGEKTFTITGVEIYTIEQERVSGGLKTVILSGKDMQVSDGYHTMKEVYQHRMVLFAALLRANFAKWSGHLAGGIDPAEYAWKSKHHSDCELGETKESFLSHKCSMFDGMFVCGIGTEPGKQITYHLPLDMFDDLKVWELIKAPEYDGHTAADVLERLKRL